MCNCISEKYQDPKLIETLNQAASKKKQGSVVSAKFVNVGLFGMDLQARIVLPVIGLDSDRNKVAEISIVLSKCPFCGEKYPNDQSETEASGTGQQQS